MVAQVEDVPLNPCGQCGGAAHLTHVSWAQPRYLARCTVSRHLDPAVGRDHTATGMTPTEAQAAWNAKNPVQHGAANDD